MNLFSKIWGALVFWLQSTNILPGTYTNLLREEGPGFGEQNKYAWSMVEFDDHLYVGTYNMQFKYRDTLKCTGQLKGLNLGELNAISIAAEPEIQNFLACLIDEGGSQIWRYSFANENWEKVISGVIGLGSDRDGQIYTGFRNMEVYQGKIYALTASAPQKNAVTEVGGTTVTALGPSVFGSASEPFLIRSSNGIDWEAVPCNATCPFNSDAGYNSMLGRRALTTFDDKLFVGTGAALGGSDIALWSLDSEDNWFLEFDFADRPEADTYVFDAITALTVFQDKMWIGLSGPAGMGVCSYTSGSGVISQDLVPDSAMPDLDGSMHDLSFGTEARVAQFSVMTMTVIDDALYVGSGNLDSGFCLMKFLDENKVELITANGFGDPLNSYVWSMAELGGQLVLGTFNRISVSAMTPVVLGSELIKNPLGILQGILDPRGSGEIWLLDEGNSREESEFLKLPMPADWGAADYGIRNMLTVNKGTSNEELYIGSGSNLFVPGESTGLGVWKVEEFGSRFLRKVREEWPKRGFLSNLFR